MAEMEVDVNTGDNVNPETGEVITDENLDPNIPPEEDTPPAEEDKPAGSETDGEEAPNSEEQLNADIDAQTKADTDAKTLLTDKGVDFDVLANEYDEKGVLSPETYKTLEDNGFPKSVVDAYIAGKEALNDRFTTTVYDYVGGKTEYAKVTDAIKLQGAEAVKSYNALVETGNLPAIKMYLNGVKATMVAKNGTSNPSIMGSNNNIAVSGYESEDALVKAISDKRYGNDEKYTLDVQRKAMQSAFFKYNQ